jgi:hypothetical protein
LSCFVFPFHTTSHGIIVHVRLERFLVTVSLLYQVSVDESSTELPPVAYPTWSLSLIPIDEDIQAALLPAAARGPVASIGKVLENRMNTSTLDCLQSLRLCLRGQCVVSMSWVV